jgi:hypothetical protein
MDPATVTAITQVSGLSINAISKKIFAAKFTEINSKFNELNL